MTIGIGYCIPNRKPGINLSSYWATRNPSALIITLDSVSSIQLDWTANGVEDYDGYSIERSTDGINYSEVDTVAVGTETFTDTGLSVDTLYYYRVKAYKGVNKSTPTNVERGRIIPEKSMLSDYTITDNMDEIVTWVSAGHGTREVNNTEFIAGTGSIKITSIVGGEGDIIKTVDYDFSMDQGRSLGVWAYPHSDIALTTSVIYIHAADATYTNFFSKTIAPLYFKQGEWKRYGLREYSCLFNSDGWSVGAGNPSWDNIKKIMIRIKANAGQTAIWSFNLFQWGAIFKPSIMISYDDMGLNNTVYTGAYPYMIARNMMATLYVCKEMVDIPNWYTSAQIQEVGASGWDIGNHTVNHPDLRTLTEAQIHAELEECKTFLHSLGLTKASSHVAYPFGDVNADVEAAMASWGGKTGRGGGGGKKATNTYNYGYPYQITAKDRSTLANHKIWIDWAITWGTVAAILWHTTNPGEELETFQATIDYIQSKGLQTLTVDEYYRLFSGAILVQHD